MKDYNNELWLTYLTEEKKDTLQKRFKTKNTKGYGLFVNGALACSAWISFGIIAYNEDTILFKNDKAALLFDAYTHSYFRGNGYHNYMIKWRLNELKHNKIEKAYTIVLSYNKPSMTNQRKCSFDIDQIFYVFKVGSKTYLTRYFNK